VKVKMSIFALILIAVLICMPKHGQALNSPYLDGIGYPGEHPWQDQEPPPSDGIVTSAINSGIVIIVIPTKMIMIRPLLIKSKLEKSNQTLKKMEFGRPTQKGND
jgi:hypothetical protein